MVQALLRLQHSYQVLCNLDPVFRADENQSEETQFQKLQNEIVARLISMAKTKPNLYRQYKRLSRFPHAYPEVPGDKADVTMYESPGPVNCEDILQTWAPFHESAASIAMRPRSASLGDPSISRREAVRRVRAVARACASPMEVDSTPRCRPQAQGPSDNVTVVSQLANVLRVSDPNRRITLTKPGRPLTLFNKNQEPEKKKTNASAKKTPKSQSKTDLRHKLRAALHHKIRNRSSNTKINQTVLSQGAGSIGPDAAPSAAPSPIKTRRTQRKSPTKNKAVNTAPHAVDSSCQAQLAYPLAPPTSRGTQTPTELQNSAQSDCENQNFNRSENTQSRKPDTTKPPFQPLWRLTVRDQRTDKNILLKDALELAFTEANKALPPERSVSQLSFHVFAAPPHKATPPFLDQLDQIAMEELQRRLDEMQAAMAAQDQALQDQRQRIADQEQRTQEYREQLQDRERLIQELRGGQLPRPGPSGVPPEPATESSPSQGPGEAQSEAGPDAAGAAPPGAAGDNRELPPMEALTQILRQQLGQFRREVTAQNTRGHRTRPCRPDGSVLSPGRAAGTTQPRSPRHPRGTSASRAGPSTSQ